ALVDEVNDKLELVQALEVSHFWCVTRFHQRFEAGLDQLDRTAAEHRLFPEQVSFGFFAEIGFDDTCATATDRAGVRQGYVASRPGRVLVYGNQRRYTTTLAVRATYRMAWRFRRNHNDVDIGARLNLTVVHVETMRERERGTGLDIVSHLRAINLSDILVRQQD